MKRRLQRVVVCIAIGGVVALIFLGRPIFYIGHAFWRDRALPHTALAPGFIDDASGLNATPVEEIWNVPADPAQAEAQLANLLRQAHVRRLPVSIAGARHSMGGHTIAPGGIEINMLPFHRLELDESANVLHVGAGARWSDVLPFLSDRGRSIAVMQSNNDFTVGGSLSVNCHGWQPNHAPIASTVDGFRLMLADGSVKHCTRTENSELFKLVLGGYGLFGIMLDADIHVVPNEEYRIEATVLRARDYAAVFNAKVRRAPPGSIGLAYGRVSVAPESFGNESILTVFHVTSESPITRRSNPTKPNALQVLGRTIFRGSVGSAYGKSFRWKAEKKVGEEFGKHSYSRSDVLDVPAELFANRTPGRTDILHEYFIPPDRLFEFLQRLKLVVQRHSAEEDPDLLNITVRDVRRDPDAFMAYARADDAFGLVLLFEQAATETAARRATVVTRELVDAAIDLGGTYYLPYRLDATPEQFRHAYPQAAEFFALKRRYDPEEIFQNEFYQKYGR
jgi:FAD/FMN-containing dehydrogenase